MIANSSAALSELADSASTAAAYLIQGDFDQAATLYERLIAAEPDHSFHYWHLGLSHLLAGHEAEAQLTWSLAMAELDLEQQERWVAELAEVLEEASSQQEGEGAIETAWVIRQHLHEITPDALNNLLHLLRLSLQLERFDPNEITTLGIVDCLGGEPLLDIEIKLLLNVLKGVLDQAAEHPQTLKFVEVSLRYLQDPDDIQAAIDLILSEADRLCTLMINNALACRYGELCLRLNPDHLDVIKCLISFYQIQGENIKGIELARCYVAACKGSTEEHLVGNGLLMRGLLYGATWAEAEVALKRQIELFKTWLAEPEPEPEFAPAPVLVGLCSYFYSYFRDKPRETRTLHNQVAARYQRTLGAYLKQNIEDYQPCTSLPLRVDRSSPKLRIGYLSRCMRRHSVGWLSRWMFEHYDRDKFEVYAYHIQIDQVSDFTTQWFSRKATYSCCLTGDTLGIAKEIQADGIDILVELDSTTFDHTCGVMALKPAPVQVSWLGFDASGIPAIDYYIADPYVLPEDAQDYYTEKIWRLPQTYIAVGGFEVGTPTLRRDRLQIPEDAVIFFSSQFAAKRYPDTIRLQMQIIREVPGSYFLLKGPGDTKTTQVLFEQIAEEEGVSHDRLRFLPGTPNEETHRANLAIADVVLDTFPYNGATTTLETLWMGIPIVTKVGNQFAARNSYTMMINAGITEGIAWSDEEYLQWGIRLGSDRQLRENIVYRLRQSRHTSPLWNAQQFTREMEKAYEQMWERYSSGNE